MEGINQDGNSERPGNGAIVGSGISQIKTTEKKQQKTEKVIFIVKVTLKYLLYLLINTIILGEDNFIFCCTGLFEPSYKSDNNTDFTNFSLFFLISHANFSFRSQ